MIVTCQSCATRYRLDEDRLKPGGSQVRCSKCGETFMVAPSPGDISPAALAQAAAAGKKVATEKWGWGLHLLILLLLAAVGSAVVYGLIYHPERIPSFPAAEKHAETVTTPMESDHPPQATLAPKTAEPAQIAATSNHPQEIDASAASMVDVQHRYVENVNAGWLLVISGVVPQLSDQASTTQAVRVALFEKNGQKIDEQVFTVGHQLTDAQLATLSVADLMARLTATSAPMPNGSERELPFMAVFASTGAELDEFSLELIETIPDK
jgi:predicted Zn finger-like uncharacterized protein